VRPAECQGKGSRETSVTRLQKLALGAATATVFANAGCTDNQNLNTLTGALAGAAVGSQLGNGSGRTAAIVTGAAVGGVIGNRQPTN
jgi:uncharacterized protein YcfJ